MEGGWDYARLPYSYENSGSSFTVFQPGSNVYMYADDIIVNPGTVLNGNENHLIGTVTYAPPMMAAAEEQTISYEDTSASAETTTSKIANKTGAMITKTETQNGETIDYVEFMQDIERKLSVNSYPNPTRGNITFDISSTTDYNLQIVDLSGRVIYDSGNINFGTSTLNTDISHLADGFFLCTIKNKSGETTTYKIIKR